MRLAGHTAVVTGAGRGIGAAVSRLLAAEGATVIASARSQAEIEAVADEIRSAGGTAHAVTCDVGDASSIESLKTQAHDLAGPVDILINNAGVSTSAPFMRVTPEEWERLWRINTTGPLLCTQAFLPDMLEKGWGRVVIVGSIASLAGTKYITSYTASKHGVLGMMRALAAELAGSGVTANMVCPGYVDTPMTSDNVSRLSGVTGREEEEIRKNMESIQPSGRFVTSEEVAHAVMTFLPDEGSSFQGTTLTVDGGGLLR